MCSAQVAAQIQKIHGEETDSLLYNDEQILQNVIKLAYLSYSRQYIRFEELEAGNGYVDIVYLPKRRSFYPALVIELKWNQSAKGAIAQIKEKRYPEALANYGDEILLVGINYDRDTREHSCVIEKV